MKRTITTAVVCLLMAAAATAQGVKISPKMVNGTKKVYQTEAVINAAGKEIKLSSKQTYEVVGKTADGYLVNNTISDVNSNVPDDDVAGQLIAMSMQMSNGVTAVLKTDADGKVVGIQNHEELKQKTLEVGESLINRLYEKVPGAAQMVPREMMMEQIKSKFSEEDVLKTMFFASSVVALNGKTIATGAQENYTSDQGLKMQRTYFLTKKDGTALTSNAKMNMTKDELKQMIISQVEKAMPEQAELVKQNIDMMLGQLTFDSNEKATYEMGADGWVRSLVVENQTEAMGQKTTTTTTIRLME